MTPIEIAKKYVYGAHDALTDNQEVVDMIKDIEDLLVKQNNKVADKLEEFYDIDEAVEWFRENT